MKISVDGKDILAWIIVIGCIILIAFGIDTEVKSILAVAAGFAFGRPIVRKIRAITGS